MSIVLFVLKSKNIFNKLVLYMACFLGWLKETCNFCGSWQVIKNKTKTKKTKNIFRQAFKNINNTKLTIEADKSQKKEQVLNLYFIQHYQRSDLLLNTNGLKLISIQEKRMFTTCFFKYTFMVKVNKMKIFFMFPLEVTKININYFHPYAPSIKYVQHYDNNFCFVTLVSALFDAR